MIKTLGDFLDGTEDLRFRKTLSAKMKEFEGFATAKAIGVDDNGVYILVNFVNKENTINTHDLCSMLDSNKELSDAVDNKRIYVCFEDGAGDTLGEIKGYRGFIDTILFDCEITEKPAPFGIKWLQPSRI